MINFVVQDTLERLFMSQQFLKLISLITFLHLVSMKFFFSHMHYLSALLKFGERPNEEKSVQNKKKFTLALHHRHVLPTAFS